MLMQLVRDHCGISTRYIWDLPFQETVRRHATKPVATEFGEGEMRAWWRGFRPIRGLDERRIGPNHTFEATMTRGPG